ncbi:MAG: hypothetical protein U1F34_03785 [Gammaproteobacteria bacterium]
MNMIDCIPACAGTTALRRPGWEAGTQASRDGNVEMNMIDCIPACARMTALRRPGWEAGTQASRDGNVEMNMIDWIPACGGMTVVHPLEPTQLRACESTLGYTLRSSLDALSLC